MVVLMSTLRGNVAESRVDLLAGAERLVHVNGRVKPGEEVVVVTDPTMQRYADVVSTVAQEAGASVTVCVIPIRDQDGQEPPPPVARAMAEASVMHRPIPVDALVLPSRKVNPSGSPPHAAPICASELRVVLQTC